MALEAHCTILVNTDKATTLQQDEIIKDLEQPQVALKIKAIKNAITLLLSGEPMPRSAHQQLCTHTREVPSRGVLLFSWDCYSRGACTAVSTRVRCRRA
jgi:hypothetical protein